ncbi:hypothetical protein [Actinophytocola sp.]|uniref:hypothetical protein n=1 Tax=Actinophytocola sp. TaxID=1872138 RepID=UPI0025BFA282|nr:hypothetical protein [Actinophytocola sp.]
MKSVTDGHVVVHGGDADLSAIVLRLLRIERLDVAIGYVPVDPGSPAAKLWRLAKDTVDAALDGSESRVPLVRDDAGGVLLGLGVLAPVRGTVYCDDDVPLRGPAERVEVRPDPVLGLEVRVVRKGLLRNKTSTLTGRAMQYGGDPVSPVRDGVTHQRPLRRWTWYRHTDDLRVVR